MYQKDNFAPLEADKESIIFLDIETASQRYEFSELDELTQKVWTDKITHKGKEKDIDIAQAWKDTSALVSEFSRIISIVVGFIYEGKLYMKKFDDYDEKIILIGFSDFIETFTKKYIERKGKGNICLAAHNGKGFDYPVMCRRYLINKIKIPKILQIAGKKPWDIPLIDTKELWQFGNYQDHASLNTLAHVFNIPSSKDDISGADTSRIFWEEKDIKRITYYCSKDVGVLISIYLCLRLEEIIDYTEAIKKFKPKKEHAVRV